MALLHSERTNMQKLILKQKVKDKEKTIFLLKRLTVTDARAEHQLWTCTFRGPG